MVSSHIFTQWGWLFPFCPEDFPGQHKRRWNFRSSAIFRAGWTCPLFLYSSRTIHHEESTLNLWTVVPRRSILHYLFNPPRPTTPRWFKLDVKFCLWQQQFYSCSVFSNPTLAWLPRLYSCSDIQLLYSSSTITTVFFFLRLTAPGLFCLNLLLKLLNWKLLWEPILPYPKHGLVQPKHIRRA